LGKILQSFIAAFKAAAKAQGRQDEQDRYSFYEVPKSEVANIATAIQRKFEGDENPDINDYLKSFRIKPAELEKRKIERHNIPWDGLRKAGIELKQNEMENVMQGLQLPQLYLVDVKTPDGIAINTPMGFEVKTDKDGEVKVNLIAPKSVPEFEEPQYKQIFTKEDKTLFFRGMQPERLFPIPDKETGEIQWCAVSYCKELGRLVTAPASGIKAPGYWDNVKLDYTQKDIYEHAGRISLKGCTDLDGKKYDCVLQYDAVSQAPKKIVDKYEKIYIYPHLEKQLDGKQLEALKNYEAIPAAGLMKSDGTPMTCSYIWIDPNINKPSYGTLEKMKREHYIYEKSQEKTQQKEQEPQPEGEKTIRRSRGRNF